MNDTTYEYIFNSIDSYPHRAIVVMEMLLMCTDGVALMTAWIKLRMKGLNSKIWMILHSIMHKEALTSKPRIT